MYCSLCFMAIFMTVFLTGVSETYKYWTPDGNKHLWCVEKCFEEKSKLDIDYCCSCNSVPEWEIFQNVSYYMLNTEVMDIRREKSKLFNRHSYSVIRVYCGFIYMYGRLRKFPENACDFPIVTIDVTSNFFREIGNLSCFTNLDTLIMKNNLITHVSNATFLGLSNLRKLDLSNNLISSIDSNLFGYDDIHLLDIRMEGNRLEFLDISNVLIPNKTMCHNSYANNKGSLGYTNEGNLQPGTSYGQFCGSFDASNVTVLDHPFSVFGENFDGSLFVHLLPCGFFKFIGAAYNCDCKFFEFLKMDMSSINRLYAVASREFYCSSPKQLENISLFRIYEDESLRDLMTCDEVDFCHSRTNCRCRCTTQPNKQRLLIDCSNQSCTDFPEVIPNSRYGVTLLMNNNSISTINTKRYFSRVSVLDLTDNPVTVLTEKITSLEKASKVIIPNHTLQTLPKSIQHFHPGIFKFGMNGIPCNCDNVWIGEWRSFRNISAKNPLFCSNYDNTLIEDSFERIGRCNPENYYTAVFILLPFLVLVSVLSTFYYFRYEVLILVRKKLNPKKNLQWDMDLYILFDDENTEIRCFVLKMLYPFLKRKRFKSFILCIDSCPGLLIEDNITMNMQKSKCVLFIRSKGIFSEEEKIQSTRRMEYHFAWKYFMSGDVSKILILNFDDIEPNDFLHRQTKALCRVGMAFDVWNRKISVYQKLLDFMGDPLFTRKKPFIVQW